MLTVKPTVSWILKNAPAFLSGAALVLVLQHALPSLSLLIYADSYQNAYVGCELGHLHDDQIKGTDTSAESNIELRKTALIELLNCESYEAIKSRLVAWGVDLAHLKVLEVDAASHE